MSDVAIVGAVGIVAGASVAIVWLQQRAAALIRAEQRDERDTGEVARLRSVVEFNAKLVDNMRTEQKTFLANARSK